MHALRSSFLVPALAGLLVVTACDFFLDDEEDRGTPAIVEGLVDLAVFDDVPLGEIHLFAHRIDADGGSSEIVGLFTTPDPDGRYRLEVPVPDGESLDIVVKTTREGRNPRTGAVIHPRALVAGSVSGGESAAAAPLGVIGTAHAQVYLAARQILAADTERAAGLARGLTPASVAPWVDGEVASALALGNEDDVALARCRCRPGLYAEAVLAGLEAFEAALRSPVVGASTDVLEALATTRADSKRALDAFVTTTRRTEGAPALATELDLDAFRAVGLSAAERAFAFHASAAAIGHAASARNLFDDEGERRRKVAPVAGRRLAEAAYQADVAGLAEVARREWEDARRAEEDARRVAESALGPAFADLVAALDDAPTAGPRADAWRAYGGAVLAALDDLLADAVPAAADGSASVATALRCAEVGAPGWPLVEPAPGDDPPEAPAARASTLAPILTAAGAATDEDVLLAALDADGRAAVASVMAGAFMRAFAPAAVDRGSVSGRVVAAGEAPAHVLVRAYGPGDAHFGSLVAPAVSTDGAGDFEAETCFGAGGVTGIVVHARDPADGSGIARGLVPGRLEAGVTVVAAPLDADGTDAARLWSDTVALGLDPRVPRQAPILHLAHPEVMRPMRVDPPTLRALHAEAAAAHLEARAAVLAGVDGDGACCTDPAPLEALNTAEAAAWRADAADRDALAGADAWPPDAETEAALRAAVKGRIAGDLAAADVAATDHLVAEIAGARQRLDHLAFRDLRHPSTWAGRTVVHRDLAARVIAAHALALDVLDTDAVDDGAALLGAIDESLGDGGALRAAWAAYEDAVIDAVATALDAVADGAGVAFLDLRDAFDADAAAHADAVTAARGDLVAIAAAYTGLDASGAARIADSDLAGLDDAVRSAVIDVMRPLLAMHAFDAGVMP